MASTKSFVLYQENNQLPDYGNEQVYQRNRLPARSYWIPEDSLLLNGVWDFNYAPSPLEAPESYHGDIKSGSSISSYASTPNESTTEDEVAAHDLEATWSKINVPGHWQLQGHGRPQYTNVIYPFPVCPPHVPTENPTGTYRREFSVPSSWREDSQLRLRFDGIDSAFHLWVNGAEVGYHQGSRNPSEFDITAHVKRDCLNEIFVRVYQWCDGSYIEDQDQWWLSGIFRDVHLIAFPGPSRIEDFFIKTILDREYKDSTLEVLLDLSAQDDVQISLTLKDSINHGEVIKSETISAKSQMSQIKHTFKVENPNKWTAESPYLYTLEVDLLPKNSGNPVQTISERVGFRVVEIKEGLLCVNGKSILLRGVNRHDHHPHFGRAVPLSFIRQDLLLMKQHNINALRCSHYPSHPLLPALCDELGFWVCDEADLECHGFYDAVARPMNIPESIDYEERKKTTFGPAAKYTSDNPAWRDQYVDRMEQLIRRDKNHPCVVMWSLGNEAFYGGNHKAMYEYSKSFDSGRPVHYEGDVHAESADMFSYMYPPLERLLNLCENEGVKDGKYEKPIVLCEYGHAMGNGPGGLEEYQELFRSHKRLQGGFIWEWANHGIWKEGDNGKGGFYAYGGDFNDVPNDDTFVMDGLCFSTHKPTPGLAEFKKVIEPVRSWMDGDNLVIENGYDFEDLKHLAAVYKIEVLNGEKTHHAASGHIELPDTAAGQTSKFQLPSEILKYRRKAGAWLSISFRLKLSTHWAESGHEIAWLQHSLSQSKNQHQLQRILTSPGSINIETTKTTYTIGTSEFSFTFDRSRGSLKSWTHNTTTLLSSEGADAALGLGFSRCPTDNDRPYDYPTWQRYGIDALESQLRSLSLNRVSSTEVQITSKTFIGPVILAWGFNATITYTIKGDGSLTVNAKLEIVEPKKAPETLPRIGLNLRANPSLDEAAWFGLGPGESYPDKKASQKVSVWSSAVEDLSTNYEVPQENGNRMDTHWVKLSGSKTGHGIRATRIAAGAKDQNESVFAWQAGRYKDQILEKARHPVDLVGNEDSALLWRLDVATAGVGSAACGPGVLEPYQVKCEGIEFGFRLESTLT